MPNRPFLWPTVFAGLTILVSVWMLRFRRTVQPPHPTVNPMIDFEFATSTVDIDRLFRHPPPQQPARAFITKMRDLNRIDFLYIACYTAFSVAFVWQVHQLAPSVSTSLALFVAFVPGLFDVLENVQLFALLRNVTDQPKVADDPTLRRLNRFTWTKWVTISWLVVLLIPYFWRSGWPGYIVATVAGGVAVFGLVAFLNRHRTPVPSAYVNAVFLSSFLIMAYAIYRCVIAL